MGSMTRRFFGVLLPVLLIVGTLPVQAAELYMYRKKGCPWCIAWDREIAPAWPNTTIGKALPVRMVDLADKNQPDVTLTQKVIYTPTFVLVSGGKEVGRLEGYAGQDFFWGLMEGLVARLPPDDAIDKQKPTK